MNRSTALRQRLEARYPLLYIVHSDERDAVRLLAEAAATVTLPIEGVSAGRGDIVELAAAALDRLLSRPESALLILPLGHRLLCDAGFVRLMAEALTELELHGHVVALLAPHAIPCPELERDIVLLRVPLPTAAELTPLVAAAFRAAGGGVDAAMVGGSVQAVQGLTLGQARRALRRVRRAGLEGSAAIAELQAEKRDLVAAGGTLEIVDALPDLDAVGGLDELKEWLLRRRKALTPEARRYGLPVPRGMLVVGIQGCGKSLIAKASAAALGLPLVRLDLGRLYTATQAPDENLRLALQIAEAMAPVVLWLDEIDKAFAHGASGGSEAGSRIFGSFLTWLGEQRAGVFVAATANRIEHLPAELMRKGRFDDTFFVDLPDLAVRAEVLTIHLRASGRDEQRFDIDQLAQAADRLTGAEIEQAVVEALSISFAEGRELLQDDLLAVLSNTVPFVETYEQQVKELREWARRRCRPASRDRSLRELYLSARSSRDQPDLGRRP